MRAPNRLRLASNLALVALVALTACDDASAPPDSGTVTLAHDDGIEFANGTLQEPGNFANSDIYATANGDSGMKLATGGRSIVENRPITWFKNGGGLARQFPDLASVPVSPAPVLPADPMLHAKVGNGFLLETARGDHVRGWVAAASATSVTLQWERLTQ